MFKYRGEISASKSLMNRALVVQSYEPQIELLGTSQCSDVVHMKKALEVLNQQDTLEAGEGGTTFRFLFLRASRLKRQTRIQAHPKLLARPQKELLRTAEQLGVTIEVHVDFFLINGEGWKKPFEPLFIDRSVSSQYLSGVMLNAWDLDFPLHIQCQGETRSEGYLQMTLDMLKKFGMQFTVNGRDIRVEPHQKPRVQKYRVESDVSSAFSVAAAGALFGEVELMHFPFQSLQPDIAFLDILTQMGVSVDTASEGLRIEMATTLKSVDVDLENCPDLFPVLAILCAQAEGVSRLYGAPHLVHKESDRIAMVSKLLNLIGIEHQPQKDGMVIQGQKRLLSNIKSFAFDPAQDHRMAMAAGLLKLGGAPIHILTPEVVNKSFPEFWQVLGI